MSMDTVIKRPGLWRRIISQIRVSLSGEGILYRADAKGGWFEIPFSGHKEEGKAHRYLKDGRICETSVYRAGQIEEHTERYWADIRFRLPRKSPNYLVNLFRQGELIEQRSLFRLCYTITPMKNNKPEGRACIYRPIEANQPPVSAQTKTWGHLCLHETREYHDGVEQGMRYSYYQNGQLRSEGVWKTKKVYFAFSDKQYNERLKTNPSFKARRMVGEKGSIVYVHEDLISYPQGEHKEYYPNGKMKNFSLYDEDIRDFTEFDEEGNVLMPPETVKILDKVNGRYTATIPVTEIDGYELIRYNLDGKDDNNVSSLEKVNIVDNGTDRELIFVYICSI